MDKWTWETSVLPEMRKRLGLVTEDGNSNQPIIGDRFRQLFTVDGKTLEITDSLSISSPASDIRFRENGTFDLLTMGVMDPSNFAIGKWMAYSEFDTQV